MNSLYSKIAELSANSLNLNAVSYRGNGQSRAHFERAKLVTHSLGGHGNPLLVISINELERLNLEQLHKYLWELRAAGNPCIFIVSTIYSSTLEKDGSNVVKTVKNLQWWSETIENVFNYVYLFPEINHHEAIFMAWRPSEKLERKLRRSYKASKLLHRLRELPLRATQPLRVRLNRFMAEGDIFCLVENKTVALVGNATSLSETTYGAAIDGHDLVIRCNRTPITSAASHGGRTDWIATSIDIPEQLAIERGAKVILWMSPRLKRLRPWLYQWPNVFMNSKTSHRKLTKLLGGRPSTGAMVIDLLSRSNCSKVDLYGFDFFASGSLSGFRTLSTTPHDFGSEEVWVQQLLDMDKRFTLHR